VVVTLWPVEDRWAQAFGLAFHRGLLQGLRPSEACAQARRALRAQGATVAQWAAFRSLGSD
jgi:CHAT domain-containing protein